MRHRRDAHREDHRPAGSQFIKPADNIWRRICPSPSAVLVCASRTRPDGLDGFHARVVTGYLLEIYGITIARAEEALESDAAVVGRVMPTPLRISPPPLRIYICICIRSVHYLFARFILLLSMQ